MRITNINIPKDPMGLDGLDAIKMNKLGTIVLLAGKNGSGKTRILNKIFSTFGQKPTPATIQNNNTQIQINNTDISSIENELIRLHTMHPHINNVTGRTTAREIELAEANLQQRKSQITAFEKINKWDLIETSEQNHTYTQVNFVPKKLDLGDCNNVGKNQLNNWASQINSIGTNSVEVTVLAKIQVVQDTWFNATHPDTQISTEQKQQAIEAYDKLKKLIHVFLNTELGRDGNGDATLFGFRLGMSNLSDGQKILLQFCGMLYSQETALKDLILVLDEPENHLHPSVIIETIERIQQCVTNGQIWIATHSIPLLAHFNPTLLWFVEDNRITHAGKIPEKVMHSLLGDNAQVEKLQEFISLPAQLASSRYAFECLLPPEVFMTGATDPQSLQIRANLLQIADGKKLKVLDFGAGKGRLISNLFELEQLQGESLLDKIDYIAYDKFPTDKESCETAISQLYGTSDKRYYNDSNTLFSQHDEASFDVVIMCNVLHEIDPKDWLRFFEPNGAITSFLKDTGYLLLVEDQQIPVGEKAYQNGFLILDTAQLKALFDIKQGDEGFVVSEMKEGRLKAHHIAKKHLIKITAESRIAAIEKISALAKDKILEIRAKPRDYQHGKLHGFWTQQFANAQLILSEFMV